MFPLVLVAPEDGQLRTKMSGCIDYLIIKKCYGNFILILAQAAVLVTLLYCHIQCSHKCDVPKFSYP
jgi:hypothetical protein